MAKPKTSATTAPKTVQIRAEWSDTAALALDFADHVHVQRVGDRYFVTIGQSNFPLFEGAPQGDIKLPIRPLHRYAIAEADLRRMVGVLGGTLPPPSEKP